MRYVLYAIEMIVIETIRYNVHTPARCITPTVRPIPRAGLPKNGRFPSVHPNIEKTRINVNTISHPKPCPASCIALTSLYPRLSCTESGVTLKQIQKKGYMLYVLLSSYLCFISVLYLGLYVLRLIRDFSCEPNMYLVHTFIHSEIGV